MTLPEIAGLGYLGFEALALEAPRLARACERALDLRRVGGLVFWRLGRLGGSVYVARRRTRRSRRR